MSEHILAVDIGNSAIKAALFVDGRIESRYIFSEPEDLSSIGTAGILKDCRIAVCSVVPDELDAALAALGKSAAGEALIIDSSSPFPFAILVENPERTGVDRLCAACGAVSMGIGEAVIVDIGTAVTVDVLSSRGFEGGVIFPGPGTMIESLHLKTASLPVVDIGKDQWRLPGRSTSDAIRGGVYNGLVGAVNRLVGLSLSSLSEPGVVVLTGGGAELVADSLDFDYILCPDLLFSGLYMIYGLAGGESKSV